VKVNLGINLLSGTLITADSLVERLRPAGRSFSYRSTKGSAESSQRAS
jgi:hypothetical protein